MKSNVYIVDLGTPDPEPKALRQAVDKVFVLTGAGPKLGGKDVLIKPNILAPVPPELHVTTTPALVRAIVDATRDAGGKPAVGDNPGGVERNSMRTAETCGILGASDGCFKNLSEEVVEVKTGNPYADKFVVSKFILDAGYVINVPVFKTHLLTTLTGAVKNCFGYVAGTNKAKLHLVAFTRGRFAHALLDIYSIRVPDLHIVDALYFMEGDGPTHGHVRPLGKLVAGTDGLAVDAVLTMMMGLEPASLRIFQKAAELEKEGHAPFGCYQPDDINVFDGEGRPIDVKPIPEFVLPKTLKEVSASLAEQAEILTKLGQIRPKVKEDVCALCGDCAENCPAGAITLDPYPVVDGSKCISCFCCAELCMEGAMEVPSGEATGLFDRMFRSGGR